MRPQDFVEVCEAYEIWARSKVLWLCNIVEKHMQYDKRNPFAQENKNHKVKTQQAWWGDKSTEKLGNNGTPQSRWEEN